ncbi:MAG: class II fumarate hydratase [Myxococcus sp.]|nr:class II fumarate hydratase [Myxococcus sp.]
MTTRAERDTFGPIDVPAARLWGAQTQRSLAFFSVSTERMPREVVRALAQVRAAAARVNAALGGLEPAKADAIARAAAEVLAGQHEAEFPLSLWQTGSGTQTNMNVNEVLANRASELLGGPRGEGRLVHPNDDVNRSQSSNDVFPTAMHLAAVEALERQVLPALDGAAAVLREKARRYASVVKLGRTHLQDATPLTVGQELSGWASQLLHARAHLAHTLPHLKELAIGGTAVGTGLNAPPGWPAQMAARLSEATGHAFVPAPNPFEALSASDALVASHGALKGLAAALFKVASDVRLLASGPRAGLGELVLPENEPGSSIMPGKVNPTQAEMLTMACARVMGNDATIGFAGASGHLQLNVFRPLIIDAFLQSCRLMADGLTSFTRHCLEGLTLNEARIRENVERSLMLVTALAPHLGYDAAARIARHGHATGLSLRDAAVSLGLVTPEDFDAWVRPEAMVGAFEP